MIQKFEFKKTKIEGLIEVTPFNADDIRGCFTKDYSKEVFEQNGIHHDLQEVFIRLPIRGLSVRSISSASNSSPNWYAAFTVMFMM